MEEKIKEEKVKNTKKRSPKARKRNNGKTILVICAIGIVIGLLSCIIRVDTVKVVGNHLYTAEEIKSDLFSGKETKSLVAVLKEKLIPKKADIPYLSKYHISFENYHTIIVTVQEKEIFGCIDYGGVYVYIDVEGMVLKFDEERWEGIPIIEGLHVTKALLHDNIETNDLDKLILLQRVQTLLKQSEMNVDYLYCSPKGTFRLKLGTIQVFLGDTSELEEKIHTFVAMFPTMEGLSGTLYLNEYNSQNNSGGYRFEVDQ